MRSLRRIGVLMLGVMFLLCSLLSTVVASPGLGTGTVTIWNNAAHTDPVPTDKNGHYLIMVDETYYFLITGITEITNPPYRTLQVKVSYMDILGMTQTVWIGCTLNGGSVQFQWHVPLTAKVCETGTVHYTNPGFEDYLAHSEFALIPGHFHVIPENYLGPLGVLGAGALAMVAFATVKRRSIRIPRIS